MTTGMPQKANQPEARIDQIIKLAIFAVGGQGGGVLNSWIVDLAERNGFVAQATSVAGVAQRTGATIYYVEILPKSDRAPVFSLAPSENDVDILIAAELMEGGRALMRKFISPGKTKVIVSTHRQLATVEKVVPGDGTADGTTVLAALQDQADALLAFDMHAIAEDAGTVVSAALFGALAGSRALPFGVEAFHETVRASERGVDRSLAAFDQAYAIATGAQESDAKKPRTEVAMAPTGPEHMLSAYSDLHARAELMPSSVASFAMAGLRKVIEFQDVRYGVTYLELLEQGIADDKAADGAGQNLAYSATLAKYLANAMAYDDVIRVADAKTKPGRFDDIEVEIGATSAHLTQVTEYTHPGADEVISIMPRRFGSWFQGKPRAVKALDRLVNRGRHIRTDRIGGFLSLYLMAWLRRWRRYLLRHETEWRHIEAWMDLARDRLQDDYDFAVATLRTRRLIKGYSDTHARGLSKYDKVLSGSRLVAGRGDAAQWVGRLIDAALADPKGEQLDGALQTIRSFVSIQPEEGHGASSITTAELQVAAQK